MGNCTIFKKHMRQSYRWSDGKIHSHKEWVAKCPDCNRVITAGKSMGLYGITENSRKSAKDALYRHRLLNHR